MKYKKEEIEKEIDDYCAAIPGRVCKYKCMSCIIDFLIEKGYIK